MSIEDEDIDIDVEEPQDATAAEVIDDEGSVDKAIKRRIIKARERVDQTEMAVDRNARLEPGVEIPESEKVHIYATTVKQFLRRIEPILMDEEIETTEDYYEGVPIHTVRLVPPDTEGYPFSLVAQSDSREDRELRRMIGLPRKAELPEPHTIEIQGLRDVIEREPIVGYQWEVCVSMEGSSPNWEYKYPSVQRPIPKRAYTEAMRYADRFLQEVGIGVEIGSEPHSSV